MAHPLHPALVHFPIACWSLGTLADLASLQFGEEVLHYATVLITVGVVFAIPAMLSGLLELLRLKNQTRLQELVINHMVFAVSAWLLYIVALLVREKAIEYQQILSLVFSISGFICLSIAGWKGGKLVYENGVGVNNLGSE